MTDYYKLFDYCKKTTIENDLKKERMKKNKESRQKKQLFRIITENAYYNIKNSVDDGKNYAIIYENEYNKLIEDLMDSLILHFKPFNIIYKKKNNVERGLFEVLKDESNYVLIIDWNIINTTEMTTLNKIVVTNESKICEKKLEEKIEEEELEEEELEEEELEEEELEEEKLEEELEEEIKEKLEKENIEIKKNKNNNVTDNLLEKLGFETIF